MEMEILDTMEVEVLGGGAWKWRPSKMRAIKRDKGEIWIKKDKKKKIKIEKLHSNSSYTAPLPPLPYPLVFTWG